MPELRKAQNRRINRPALPQQCPQCSSKDLRRSRRHGLSERLRGMMAGGHPYRCRACHHRFWSLPDASPIMRPLPWLAVLALLMVGAAFWLWPRPSAETATAKHERGAVSPGMQEYGKYVDLLRTVGASEAEQEPADLTAQAGFLEPTSLKIPWELLNQPLPYVEWYFAKQGIAYKVFMYGPTLDQPPFRVFRLDPKPGKWLPEDRQVVIYAYQNPQFRQLRWQKKVPNVAGLHLDEAQEDLRRAGLVPVVNWVPTAEPEMDNVVRSQSLRPGAMAWPSTQLRLQVNRVIKTAAAQPAPARPAR